MSTWSSASLGAYVAGEDGLEIYPKDYRPNRSKMGIIYCHGRGGLGTEMRDIAGAPGMFRFMDQFAEAGFPIFAPGLTGIAGWGNNASIAQVTSAKAYLQGTMGAKAGKVLLVGQSMEHITATAWAAQHPSLVAGIGSTMPVCDLTDIHTNNRIGYAPQINAAYGGTYSQATFGASHNPVTMAAAGLLAGIPWMANYGTADATVIPSTVTAFAASVGKTATPIQGGVHGWAMTLSYDKAAALAFVKANS